MPGGPHQSVPAPRRTGPTGSSSYGLTRTRRGRPLQHRDRRASDARRPAVPRAREPAAESERLDRAFRRGLGHPAGQEPHSGPRCPLNGHSGPRPRPGHHLRRTLDEVFLPERAGEILTPIRGPNANARPSPVPTVAISPSSRTRRRLPSMSCGARLPPIADVMSRANYAGALQYVPEPRGSSSCGSSTSARRSKPRRQRRSGSRSTRR